MEGNASWKHLVATKRFLLPFNLVGENVSQPTSVSLLKPLVGENVWQVLNISSHHSLMPIT